MHKEIYDMLSELKIPVAYDHFATNKDIYPPFMAYREISTDTFKADGKTYYRDYSFEIELVTEKKDPALQKSLENILDSYNIPYDIGDEVWDNEEKIYHNYYEI